MAIMQGRANLSATAEEMAELRRTGITPEQCRRMIALRARVCDGGYCDDGAGEAIDTPAFARRLAFARWLVQRGQLGEFDVPGGRM
jgi:hypothetical protein